ncbi:hypothetical protein BGW80DRAFT_1456689 [Lactifluus volemus]|nr:hypothetical protein BGW80DRAFT_1456689 [Lactifluus volemus]
MTTLNIHLEKNTGMGNLQDLWVEVPQTNALALALALTLTLTLATVAITSLLVAC